MEGLHGIFGGSARYFWRVCTVFLEGLEGIFGGSGARVTAGLFFGGSGVTPAPGSGSGVFLEGVVTPSRPGSGVAIFGQGRFNACRFG